MRVVDAVHVSIRRGPRRERQDHARSARGRLGKALRQAVTIASLTVPK